ncbi:unnamed protein product [Merluccius merluccius]
MRCRDKTNGRQYAVKEFVQLSKGEMRQIIAIEFQLLSTLKHDNLIQVVSKFKQGGLLYCVFELMDHSIADDINLQPEGLESQLMRKYMFQTLRGINYLHSINVLHRDIKPENLLVSHSGVVKVADLGSSRVMNAKKREKMTTSIGTLCFLSPEALTGEHFYSIFPQELADMVLADQQWVPEHSSQESIVTDTSQNTLDLDTARAHEASCSPEISPVAMSISPDVPPVVGSINPDVLPEAVPLKKKGRFGACFFRQAMRNVRRFFARKRHIPPTISPDVPQEAVPISLDIPQEVVSISPDVPQEAVSFSPDVLQESVSISLDTPQEVVSISPDVPREAVSISPDIPPEAVSISPDVPQEAVSISPDILQEAVSISPDVPQEAVSISPDVSPEAVSISPDVSPEVVSISPDVPPEAVSIRSDVPPDICPDAVSVKRKGACGACFFRHAIRNIRHFFARKRHIPPTISPDVPQEAVSISPG